MNESRKQIYIALSELFLDTDTASHFDHISDVCASSEFSAEALSTMLYNDVAPVCMPNLLMVAGEWSGFDEDQLMEKIIEQQSRKKSSIAQLFKPQWGFIARIYIGKDWNKVKELIEEKRNAAID